MREYGRVATKTWESEDFHSLSDNGKLLLFYLLSSPHSNMLGAYRLTTGTASDDLHWDTDRVSKGFPELDQVGIATRCERSKWVVIHKYLLWNPVKGPQQREGLVKVVRTVPRGSAICTPLWRNILQYVQELEPKRADAIKAHLDPQGDVTTIPLPLGIHVPPIAGAVSGAVAGSGIKEGGGSSTPPPPAGVPNPDTSAAAAYAAAYLARYKVAPVIGPKEKAQFRQLTDRIGGASLAIAEFYVGMDRKVYIDSLHCVDLLLRDAAGIHTEWKRKQFPSMELVDWWTSLRGIRAKGVELGVVFEESDTAAMVTARVFVAAGEGPWRKKIEPVVLSFMQELARLREAAA